MNKTEIKVLSLLNGQELVGFVSTGRTNSYQISNPLVIVPQQGPNNQSMGFGFMPWPIFGNNETYDVDFAHVVVAYVPRPEVINGYNETMQKLTAAKSGLILPPQSKPRLIIE